MINIERELTRRIAPLAMLHARLGGSLLAASLLALCACGPVAAQPARTAAAKAIASGYVPLPDGARIFYEKIGSGDQIVLLPGRLFLIDDFHQLASPDRTLIFYDTRNRGKSSRGEDPKFMTVEQDVRDMEIVRKHLGVEKMSLIGYSYMGLMAVMYALDHPGRVERIVQIGPVARKSGVEYPKELTAEDHPPKLDEAEMERARKLRESGWDAANPKEYCEIAWSINRFFLVGDPANVDKLGDGWCDMPNEYPVNLRRHLEVNFGSVQKLDLPEEAVRKLQIPVLTIHGTWDRNAPYGGGREWAATLPQGRLVTIAQAAHHPWADAPNDVFPTIDTFLTGRWPAEAERVTGRVAISETQQPR